MRRTLLAVFLAAVLGAACAGAPAVDARVGLTEMAVRAPATVAAGVQAWEVTNTGAAHHNLTICPGDVGRCEGEPVDQRLLVKPEGARDPEALPDVTAALVVGEDWTAVVEVDLAPGRYRLYCAVANHAVKGMDAVVEAD